MRPKPALRVLTEKGSLAVLAVVAAMLFGVVAPAYAQLFNFPGFGSGPPRPPRGVPHGGGGGGGGLFGDFFAPFQPPPPRAPVVREDYSHAPPPPKRDTVAERNVLVLGDSMADWLAYGLEDAYSETPEMGVIRKFRTVSGLIRYQPRGEPSDWAEAAKGILATEKPDAIVVMLGLFDRMSIREPAPDKNEKKAEKKDAHGKPEKPEAKSDAKSDDKSTDTDLSDDADDAPDQPRTKAARTPNGIYPFKDDRWVELYNKKIDEMIAVLKSKGVPVLWVGLPAVRGTKSTSDMLFLDSLYREAAARAGITYVDVWDGFVDEAGRYLQQGPDFEGQIRRLRSYDGVYFTKAGARKLAHYVEREINRVLSARSAPITIPDEPEVPGNAVPGGPAPRPMVGPIIPLVASSISPDRLLGAPGSRPVNVDALASKTLVKGEPLAAPAGRADDFVWPRRDIGIETAKGDAPAVSAIPTAPTSAVMVEPATPAPPPKPKPRPRPQPPQAHGNQGWPGFFNGFGPFSTQPSRPPPRPHVPRPPANVGRAAEAPGFFSR